MRFAEEADTRAATKAILEEPVPGNNTAEAMRRFDEKADTRRNSANRVSREAQDRHEKATQVYDQLDAKGKEDMAAFAPVLSDAEAAKMITKQAGVDAQNALKQATANLKAVNKLPTTPRLGYSYDDLLDDMRIVAGGQFDNDTYALLNAYGLKVSKMTGQDADIALWDNFVTQAKAGKLNPLFEAEALDGFEKFATSNLIDGQDNYMRSEMARALRNTKVAVRQEPRLLGKVIDAYTKFFKNWATSTPGFHVRNAISAMFMNLTEGVTFREMLDGGRIWQTYRKDPMGDWVDALPKRLQPNAKQTVAAVLGSGAGGRYTAAELGKRAFGEAPRGKAALLYENPVTKYSQNWGERVEGIVRSGLALNAAKQGQDVGTAVSRISRVHFDYSEVNEWDQSMRRAIPFWTFMSRNVPLQIQQMWLKPRTYAHYNSLRRNLDDDPNGERFMPEYLQKMDAFALGPGSALAPDIGSTQLFEQIENLATPSRMISQLNPAYQVPASLIANKDFYYNEEYRPNDFVQPGAEMSPLMPLLQAVGLAESTERGPAMERRYLNAVQDLIPVLGTINRAGATTENREGRELQGMLNLIGVPYKQITPDMEKAALRSQRYEARQPDPADARRRALLEYARG